MADHTFQKDACNESSSSMLASGSNCEAPPKLPARDACMIYIDSLIPRLMLSSFRVDVDDQVRAPKVQLQAYSTGPYTSRFQPASYGAKLCRPRRTRPVPCFARILPIWAGVLLDRSVCCRSRPLAQVSKVLAPVLGVHSTSSCTTCLQQESYRSPGFLTPLLKPFLHLTARMPAPLRFTL